MRYVATHIVQYGQVAESAMLADAHDTMHLECQAQICDAWFVHHNDVSQVNDEATACTTAQQTHNSSSRLQVAVYLMWDLLTL